MFIPKAITFLNSVDTSLKLISLVLTFIIFWKGYRLYKIYEERSLLYFSAGFLFFTLGNLFSFMIDTLMYIEILTGGAVTDIFRMRSLIIIFLALRYGSFILGFLSLFFIALGFPNRRVQMAILLLTVISGYLSSFRGLFYHIIVTLFTVFILIDLYLKYQETGKKLPLFYFLGMTFIYLAYMGYVFYLVMPVFYWIGHAFELLSYTLFIITLFSVIKNETKKRKA